jgi:hypothetical protein
MAAKWAVRHAARFRVRGLSTGEASECHGKKPVHRSPIIPSPFFAATLTDLRERAGVRVSRATFTVSARRKSREFLNETARCSRLRAKARAVAHPLRYSRPSRRAAIDENNKRRRRTIAPTSGADASGEESCRI